VTRSDPRATARIATPWIALLWLASGCVGPPGATAVYAPWPGGKTVAPLTAPIQLYLGRKQGGWLEFALDGGQLEFEVYNSYRKVAVIARNRYAAPVVVRWTVPLHENLDSPRPLQGIALLPAAATPLGVGSPVLLSQLQWVDLAQGHRVQVRVDFSFGDPFAEPTNYAYGLPYPAGLAFRVGQGFRGAQTHTGANEFAVDFNCPVGTPVLAMRPGVVIVTNASALYGGTTSYHMDWKQGNFVLLLHDDGTIAHYVHLAPDGVLVKAGQRVERGEQIGVSGETGFATGPHLHVDVSTSAREGDSRSFPFRFAVAPGRDEEPVEGQEYSAWEAH
jgi:murein DD-endopeptidase MepM/ murein hydrolase activator NlpD